MIWCYPFFLSHVFIYCYCTHFSHMSDWHFQSSLLPTPPVNINLVLLSFFMVWTNLIFDLLFNPGTNSMQGLLRHYQAFVEHAARRQLWKTVIILLLSWLLTINVAWWMPFIMAKLCHLIIGWILDMFVKIAVNLSDLLFLMWLDSNTLKSIVAKALHGQRYPMPLS